MFPASPIYRPDSVVDCGDTREELLPSHGTRRALVVPLKISFACAERIGVA
jgi:hypothetical protein